MQFDSLQQELRTFAEQRDWVQFHSPKNLAMALSVEASELVEIFQWLSQDESQNLSSEQLEAVAQEIADVQIYLARIADVLGVNVEQAVAAKLDLNRQKYPVSQVKGSAKKYTSSGAD